MKPDVITPRALMDGLVCLRRSVHRVTAPDIHPVILAEAAAKRGIVQGLLSKRHDARHRGLVAREAVLSHDELRFSDRSVLKYRKFKDKVDVALYASETVEKLSLLDWLAPAASVSTGTTELDDVTLAVPADLLVIPTSTLYTVEVGSSPQRLRGIAMAMSLLTDVFTYGGIVHCGDTLGLVTFDMKELRTLAQRALKWIRMGLQHVHKDEPLSHVACTPHELICRTCPLVMTEQCPESKALQMADFTYNELSN